MSLFGQPWRPETSADAENEPSDTSISDIELNLPSTREELPLLEASREPRMSHIHVTLRIGGRTMKVSALGLDVCVCLICLLIISSP